MTGKIFNIQHFSIHDGPGIRTTVFFKGCNLRCYWCHNPESQSFSPEIQFDSARCIGCEKCVAACPKSDGRSTAVFTPVCDSCGSCADVCCAGARKLSSREYTVGDILALILPDRDLYDKTSGGVTLSGGEPFMQSDFLYELLTALKAEGINTAVESAACVSWNIIEPALALIDLFICDIKSLCDAKHTAATSRSNRLILENIKTFSLRADNLLLRTPVIPGFNAYESDLTEIADFIALLPAIPHFELLPFSGICKNKYSSLNRTFEVENLTPPTTGEMERFADIFRSRGIDCTVNDN